MRIATDGYIDLTDRRRVRTPGYHDHPAGTRCPRRRRSPSWLSHSFKGHRRIVRPLSLQDRKRIRLALWADSVSERMTLGGPGMARAITEPVMPPVGGSGEPYLVQVVRYGNWAYPLYLDGDSTRVIPLSGMPIAEAPTQSSEEFDVERKTA